MSESLGSYLKQKREELNLSIEDVSRQTRLKEYLLQGIEEDNLEAVGEQGYVKILIITYCRAIHADEQKVLLLLDQRYNKVPEAPIKIKTAKQKKKKVLISPSFFYSILLCILIAGISYGVYYLHKEDLIPSFEGIKSQLTQNDRGTAPTTTPIVIEPDTLMLMQRNIVNDLMNQTEILRAENLIVDSNSSQNAERERIIRNILEDSTDYISEFLFNNVTSPLNPPLRGR